MNQFQKTPLIASYS